MEKNVNKQNEKLFIDITLELIDEHRGLRGVTLREITKKAGCKHTNIYNYFDKFEDLLWASLAEAVRLNMNLSNVRMSGCNDKKQQLTEFAKSQIEFAGSHPGLYHLMWVETLKGSPSTEISSLIYNPYQSFFEFMKMLIPSEISDKEIQRIADIIHSYLHGEICKLINNRFFNQSKEDYCSYIVDNVEILFRTFAKDVNK